MACKLGICTRYHQHELTRAAIQLADMAAEVGVPVGIKATNVCYRNVTPRWDSAVTGANIHFEQWAADKTHIIWMECPPGDVIEWTNEQGIIPWLFGLWDTIHPEHKTELARFDRIIVPYLCMAKVLGVPKKIKIHHITWDSLLPLTQKRYTAPEQLRLFVPLMDNQGEKVEIRIFDVMEHLIRHRSNVHITFALGSGWVRYARERIKKLKKQFKDRVTVIDRPDEWYRMKLYAEHDLTLWLSQWEGIGTVGIDSLKMGTPVVAWENEPQIEYLRNGVNSWLIPCNLSPNWLGMGEVLPNYEYVFNYLLKIVDDAALRCNLQSQAAYGLAARNKSMWEKWQALWC